MTSYVDKTCHTKEKRNFGHYLDDYGDSENYDNEDDDIAESEENDDDADDDIECMADAVTTGDSAG